ncbi:hypothetical protein QRD02_11245 [Aequorivita sp. SDUM287046]|uniref:Uncharacterized protein n=1 Tax=Aequorivita aurantiaca TaxID=3053356 RepID=A0ABT8DHT0_9FLAO|nr:hypothetical protein [Aequorivita aurantiaca]MDN3724961.1 hypothetical protein [Aequorivita aurantiaca]
MKNKDNNSKENTSKENNSKEKLPYDPNITEHDKDILRQENIHGDGGDDQFLKDRKEEVDFSGEDLDVPGSNNYRKGQGTHGLPDEENQLYSQGGDSKENLERDDSSL